MSNFNIIAEKNEITIKVKMLKGEKGDKGDPGSQGEPGAPGDPGAPGVGVPAGGTTGQILKKKTNADYDTEWGNEPTAPVTDVQVNGTSVLSNGVANIPTAGTNVYGVVKKGDNLTVVENVSGSTPTITGVDNHRYVCGEVATLTIAPPATGCIDVVFESGSTATVLTVTPPTGVTAVLWPDGFDPTSLDASTIYEINILDGKLAEVGKWATT